ncbi:MAG: hypothetical protein ABIC40_00860 [bacterium]
MNELNESGYFPIRPVDPIDLTPINFGNSLPEGQDFVNLKVEPSVGSWVIKGKGILFPNNEWIDYEWKVDSPLAFESGKNIMFDRQEKYPNAEAMRGAMLAQTFYFVVFDYETRRAEIPETADKMLDLWYVYNDWGKNDPDIESFTPGTFTMGISPKDHIVVFMWYDLDGNFYSDAHSWNPWPEGWKHVPTAEDIERDHGLPLTNGVDKNYVPEKIIWKCSLK